MGYNVLGLLGTVVRGQDETAWEYCFSMFQGGHPGILFWAALVLLSG